MASGGFMTGAGDNGNEGGTWFRESGKTGEVFKR